LISGVLWVVAELLFLIPSLREQSAEVAASGASLFQSTLFLLGGVLLLGGLVGLYARHLENLGTLGMVGFLVAFVGTALVVGSLWTSTFAIPAVAEQAPAAVEAGPPPIVLFGNIVSWGLLTVGWLLLGVAILRAGVYPRLLAILLAVGAVIAFLPIPFSAVPFAVAVAWIGVLSLRSGGGISAEQPSRVR
jgi:hypothetical protein